MKKIENFLKSKPSYTKWGNERLAAKTGLALSTIQKFKKTSSFKEIKESYLKGC